MGVTHRKVTAIPDDPAYDVGSDEWNDTHLIPASGFEVGDGGPSVSSGAGDPEGSVTAEPGSLYLRTNGTLYIKATGSGDTGWRANLTV